jgi:hypothetical protein
MGCAKDQVASIRSESQTPTEGATLNTRTIAIVALVLVVILILFLVL